MEEYIEKNQLKEKLRSLFKYESFPIADIEQIIDWLPVVPKRGGWIYEQLPLPLSDGSKECVRCSVCGTHWDNESNYCPYCGARMNGVIEDE